MRIILIIILLFRFLEPGVWCTSLLMNLRRWWVPVLRCLPPGTMSLTSCKVCCVMSSRRRERNICAWYGDWIQPTNACRLDLTTWESKLILTLWSFTFKFSNKQFLCFSTCYFSCTDSSSWYCYFLFLPLLLLWSK